jgi:hypothetical protein
MMKNYRPFPGKGQHNADCGQPRGGCTVVLHALHDVWQPLN